MKQRLMQKTLSSKYRICRPAKISQEQSLMLAGERTYRRNHKGKRHLVFLNSTEKLFGFEF